MCTSFFAYYCIGDRLNRTAYFQVQNDNWGSCSNFIAKHLYTVDYITAKKRRKFSHREFIYSEDMNFAYFWKRKNSLLHHLFCKLSLININVIILDRTKRVKLFLFKKIYYVRKNVLILNRMIFSTNKLPRDSRINLKPSSVLLIPIMCQRDAITYTQCIVKLRPYFQVYSATLAYDKMKKYN